MSRFFWLDGLDRDLREHVLFSLRVLWTQASNALEGNTFSKGDTLFFLREGLTVSGKTLQEHLEIKGHSDAVERMAEMAVGGVPLGERELFELHRLVQTAAITDVYRPVGAWKRENNGTQAEKDGKLVWHEYPSFEQTPKLMERWISEFATLSPKDRAEALLCYAKAHISFVSIHPFFDGNGRMARLLANFPLLRNGFPPIIIQRSARREYIDLLSAFQKMQASPFPELADCQAFTAFLETQWSETWEIINAAHGTQATRRKMSGVEGPAPAEQDNEAGMEGGHRTVGLCAAPAPVEAEDSGPRP